MSDRDQPTCAIGFWEPLHAGCPVCGPDGPCTDPEYEAVIQANLARKKFRKEFLLALLVGLAILAVGIPLIEVLA